MSGKPVARYTGNDSGSICPCQSPAFGLIPEGGTASLIASRKVYIENIAVMAGGDILTPAPGTICDDKRPPCTNPRKVVSLGKVFVGGKPIGHIKDFLNQSAAITIVGVPTKVFASES
jgi:hypothetical protein